MRYLEIFLQVVFTGLVIVMPVLLMFALACEAFGWYDSKGRYCGPFSKSRGK